MDWDEFWAGLNIVKVGGGLNTGRKMWVVDLVLKLF